MYAWLKHTLWLSLAMVILIWSSVAYAQFTTESLTRYTVGTNGHFSFPRVIKWSRKPATIQWSAVFDKNCNYRIVEADGSLSRDQKDWNKLCGVFFTLFNTRGEAAMIGWRYNPDTDLIELAPYYHIERGRDMFPPLLALAREQSVDISLQIDYRAKNYRWVLRTATITVEHEMPFTHSRSTCGFINFYFGGNRPAPQEVSCRMRMQIDK
jgi:hypothetical protein